MSKQKRGRDERRRAAIEINLLPGGDDRRILGRARRGCSLPFLGGVLILVLLLLMVHAPT